jgi:hypothetical protein
VASCPPSLGQTGVKIEASTQCSKVLSSCCTTAVTRMLLSHPYTSPTPAVEGTYNVSRSTAIVATFWLALMKVGSCRYTCSVTVVRPASSSDSRWCRPASLVSMATRSLVGLPYHSVASCLMSSYRACWCSGPLWPHRYSLKCRGLIRLRRSPDGGDRYHGVAQPLKRETIGIFCTSKI